MTTKQYEELKEIIFYDREFGAAAFARRHRMTVRSVYHWRKKLSMPIFKSKDEESGTNPENP